MKASLGLAILTGMLSLISEETHHLILLAPFGSTGVILFLMPQSAFSKPYRVIGAHFLSALVGMIFVHWGALEWYWLGIATGSALFLVTMLGLDHPPAGANPIIVMLLQPDWTFLLTPILAGTICLVLGAFLYNKLAHRRVA